MLRVSVVMPCYNAERFIREAIESVHRQTQPPHEILVIDDGSTDESCALAAGLGARMLFTGGREGPAAARNLGIAQATGDLVAFLDADDTWSPEHCQHLVELLERHPDAGLAFARARTFGQHSVPLGAEVGDSRPRAFLTTLLATNLIVQSAVVARREALERVGGYRRELRMAEDFDLWLRLAVQNRFVASDQFSVAYRVHDGQASRNEAALSRGACEARRRVWQTVRLVLPPDEIDAIERIMREAWDRSLMTAWKVRDSETLRLVMALHPLVPGSEEIRRRWLTRILLYRWPWRAAATVWDAMGPGARRRLQGLKRLIAFQGPVLAPGAAGPGRPSE